MCLQICSTSDTRLYAKRLNRIEWPNMDEYLKEFHQEEIVNLLNDNNDFLHVSLFINLGHLHRMRPQMFADVVRNVWEASALWNKALFEAQKELIEGNGFLDPGFQIKENCHVRFVNLPLFDGKLKGSFPGNDHIGRFVQIKGNVVRITQHRLLEFKREYQCRRCKESFILQADYNKLFVFDTPKKCLGAAGCKGNLYLKNDHPRPDYCMDYQEIRIQEQFSDKTMPASLTVSLENDLVDFCHPGDCVTVCGTIERRWKLFVKGKRSEVVIALRAVSICKDEEKINFGKDLSEQLVSVRAQWQDTIDAVGQLNARDMVIQSICPEINGMYLVKLAIALALCSGGQCNLTTGHHTRECSHLLLIGDPGLAKSKLLKAASRIALRSVHTTGMGCSAAGLTAAAIKEDGEWQLEAGVLVLADGGVCCIDEFNLMRENDKASIHEAMEQQTISMAKAGLVCKLSTRCVVLAATNPRNLYTMSESEGTSFLNIGISSPLLSRFDIVIILRDERDPEWDNRISDHILQNTNCKTISDGIWDLERLQSHFLAIQNISPELTVEANTILGSYYKYCRSDPMRHPSRSTVRLLDSLNRLSQAHARLMFREKVEAIDAIVTIRLMESSWGFGRLLKSIHILRESLPLGPSESQIHEFITLLGVQNLEPNIFENYDNLKMNYSEYKSKKDNQDKTSPKIGNLENLFGFNKKSMKRFERNSSPKGSTHEVSSEKSLIDDTNENDKSTELKKNDCPVNGVQTRLFAIDTVNATESNKSTLESFNYSTILENSLDTELFDNFDFGEMLSKVKIHTKVAKSITNKKNHCIHLTSTLTINQPTSSSTSNISKTLTETEQNSKITESIIDKQDKCKPSTTTENEPPSSTVSSTILPNRLFTPIELDMIDNADLQLDTYFQPLPKSNTKLREQNKINISKKSLNSIANDVTRKRTGCDNSIQNRTVNYANSIQPHSSKKPCISSDTIAKLNSLMNPNLVERDPQKNGVHLRLTEQTQHDSEDSAYDTVNEPFLDGPLIQSTSHYLAAQDDDLSCFDFNI